MSADIVQAQYEQLEQLAARFATAAETQQALLQRVHQRVDVLRQGGWQGKGVAAFLQEMDGEVGPAVGRLIGATEQAAQTTQKIAAFIRSVDLDASQPFQSKDDRDHVVTIPRPIFPSAPLQPDISEDGPSKPTVSAPERSPNPSDSTGKLNREQINRVIDELNAEGTARYQPNYRGRGETYCNIYVKDAAKKLGIPLPEYLDWNKDGTPDDYLNANEMLRWMNGSLSRVNANESLGPDVGWRQITQAEAVRLAKDGNFVVAGWQNPNPSNPGHMALVRPDSEIGNIQIAQAGGKNFSKGSLADGFGSDKVSQVIYYIYEKPAT